MRILHTVENYWPATGGMAEAVRQVSERLTDRGHDITVATGHHQQRGTALHNGVKIAEFRVSGNWAKGMSGNVDSYRQFVRGGGFDLLVPPV